MIDFTALAAPFPPEEVSWRLGSVSKEKMRGMALAYLDARNVLDRLDAVCGPDGWQDTYPHAGQKTVCSIGIWCGPERGWVYKANGAGDSDIEAEKGALSDAFKRAGVQWGIGRYLYMLDSPWVEIEEINKTGKFRIVKGAYRELDMILRRFNQSLLAPKQPSGLAQAKDDIAAAQNAGEQPVTELKSHGRLAAELWASQILGMFKLPGFDVMAYRDWQREPCTPKGTKTNDQKFKEMREKHPDLTDKIDEAAADLRVAAA